MSQTTIPSGADVDVLTVFDDCISKLEYHYRDTRAGAEMTQARTAVAALIARNAELEARIRSACQMIVAEIGADGPCNLEDAAAKLIADRDALAAENKALKADAERWQEVSRRFDGSKTSASCLTLEGLGLEPTPYRSFAENVDAAIARTPAKDDAL